MNEQQRQAHLAALRTEQAAYQRRGQPERAAQVAEQIALHGGAPGEPARLRTRTGGQRGAAKRLRDQGETRSA